MDQDDEKLTEEKRILKICGENQKRGVPILEFVEDVAPELLRRIEHAEREIKQLQSQHYVIEDIPNRVKETVQKEFKDLAKSLRDDFKKETEFLSKQITPITNTRKNISNTLSWIGGITLVAVFFGLSSDEISAVIAAVIKYQFSPVPGLP